MDDFGHMVIRTLTGFVNRLKISTGAEFQLGYSYRGKNDSFLECGRSRNGAEGEFGHVFCFCRMLNAICRLR